MQNHHHNQGNQGNQGRGRVRGRGTRRQGGGNQGGGYHPHRIFESNGPDVKLRGTAQYLADRYQQLSRDSHASGDRIMAENYSQHAEHYVRIALLSSGPIKNAHEEGAYSERESFEEPFSPRANSYSGSFRERSSVSLAPEVGQEVRETSSSAEVKRPPSSSPPHERRYHYHRDSVRSEGGHQRSMPFPHRDRQDRFEKEDRFEKDHPEEGEGRERPSFQRSSSHQGERDDHRPLPSERRSREFENLKNSADAEESWGGHQPDFLKRTEGLIFRDEEPNDSSEESAEDRRRPRGRYGENRRYVRRV